MRSASSIARLSVRVCSGRGDHDDFDDRDRSVVDPARLDVDLRGEGVEPVRHRQQPFHKSAGGAAGPVQPEADCVAAESLCDVSQSQGDVSEGLGVILGAFRSDLPLASNGYERLGSNGAESLLAGKQRGVKHSGWANRPVARQRTAGADLVPCGRSHKRAVGATRQFARFPSLGGWGSLRLLSR